MKKTHQLHARLVQGFSQVAKVFGHRIPLSVLVIFIAVIYSSFSVLRHQHFTSGAYDLGIFDQVIWQYSRFHAPYTSVRSNVLTENLLGDHFHPILALLSPLYWFTDQVEALLIAQALLFAIAIVPIFLFTEKRLGRAAAYLFAISYAVFWGIQRAVEFDFHEVALAVPLLAWAIYFVDEKKWMPYFVCLGLLLLTKENLSVTVFFFGVYLVMTKQFKQGLISMAAGIFWFFAAIRIFIPFFTDTGTMRADRIDSYYRYWSYYQFGSDPWSALKTVVTNPLLVVKTLVTPVIKLQTYWYIFCPFLFLAFFSPLFILAIPLIAERFLSDGAQFWGMDFHYTATLAPVVAMASVDGLARIARLMKKERASYLIIATSVLVLAINVYLLPRFPLWKLTSPAYWQLSASDRVGHQAISLIPRDASVTAQSPITPHLAHRRMIYVLNPFTVIPDADFIVASNRISVFPFPGFQDVQYYLDAQQARGYRKIFEREGWFVLKRESLTGEPIPIYNDATFVEQLVPPSMTAGQTYDVHVTLKNTGVNPWTASGFYRLAFLSRTNDWGIERVEVPSSITSGSIVKFDFKVTAPTTPGTYSFRWGMVQEGVAFFGQSAPQVMINVELPK